MLSLNDPRWSDLCTRNGGAAWVPKQLAALMERPDDLPTFQDLWPELCSEGTAWSSAYAAVPYLVELAKRVPPNKRLEYLYVVGLVVMCSCPECGESFAIHPYLEGSYQRALVETLPLLGEMLSERHDVTDTRYLLAAIAALKGHQKLGEVLNHLDCICCECPKCGEKFIYPEELQEAAG
jgi:hypothetical protein